MSPPCPAPSSTGDDEDTWRSQAGAVGYPLLVKAAAGGGGRGMRLVGDEDELADAVRSARREAASSFGDPTVFAERWLADPRHVEVQIVADQHGRVVHLAERECSIQRRHQKLVEEAPSTAVDPVLRDQLGAAAVSLARAIGYDSVGTVEFLLDVGRREFFFLEMNTRIQVEHRVTEEVTGCDLVWFQIQSATGEPLEWEQEDTEIDGHAIEVRVYAEDPARDWAPSTGPIHHVDYGLHRVLVDDSLTDGYLVPPGWAVTADYDAMLAKVVAHGYTREIATGRLVRALTSLELHGVTTNRDYLLAVLQHPDFVAGRTTTLFVADHPALLEAGPTDDTVAEHAAVAVLWARRRERHAGAWPFAPEGWRNVGPPGHRSTLRHRDHDVPVRVAPADGAGRDRFEVEAAGRTMAVRVLSWEGATVVAEIDGETRTYRIRSAEQTWYVNSSRGQTDLVELPRFATPGAASAAGGPTAPVPGRIVSIEVRPGDVVAAGQRLVVLEAMKVEHQILAAMPGTVLEVLVADGDTVDAHQLLIRVEEPT